MNLKFKVVTVQDEDKFGMPILIIGFILSLWTDCIFLLALDDRADFVLPFTVMASHSVLSFYVSKAVLVGLQKKEPALLKAWIYTKIIEGIFLFSGTVLLAVQNGRYVALTPVGIIFLMIGLYITLCMWRTYKQMIPVKSQQEEALPDKPPAYESFTNQTLK